LLCVYVKRVVGAYAQELLEGRCPEHKLCRWHGVLKAVGRAIFERLVQQAYKCWGFYGCGGCVLAEEPLDMADCRKFGGLYLCCLERPRKSAFLAHAFFKGGDCEWAEASMPYYVAVHGGYVLYVSDAEVYACGKLVPPHKLKAECVPAERCGRVWKAPLGYVIDAKGYVACHPSAYDAHRSAFSL